MPGVAEVKLNYDGGTKSAKSPFFFCYLFQKMRNGKSQKGWICCVLLFIQVVQAQVTIDANASLAHLPIVVRSFLSSLSSSPHTSNSTGEFLSNEITSISSVKWERRLVCSCPNFVCNFDSRARIVRYAGANSHFPHTSQTQTHTRTGNASGARCRARRSSLACACRGGAGVR